MAGCEIGASCDDGDVTTENDVFNDDCKCQGTFNSEIVEPSFVQMSSSQRAWLKKSLSEGLETFDLSSQAMLDIPVKIHIVHSSSGSNNVSKNTITQLFSRVNNNLIEAKIRLMPCEPYNNFIYASSNAFDSEKDYKSFAGIYNFEGVINMYFFEDIIGSIGFSFYPDENNNIDMIALDVKPNHTLWRTALHQIGHYFSLLHTHEGHENLNTQELVDGSNCDLAGDWICSTPAEPNLLDDAVDSDCKYIGTELDQNSQPYTDVPTSNFMSYSTDICKKVFTLEQRVRIGFSAREHRNYLNFDCQFQYGKLVDTRDGKEYKTVKIGGQRWMAENLNTSVYSNGDVIPNVTDQSQWSNLTSGAFCWYENDPDFAQGEYQKLYNWFVAVDDRNVCPTGWHVPTNDDLNVFLDFLGGVEVAGGNMKSTGKSRWAAPNYGATNSSYFSADPHPSRGTEFSALEERNFVAHWWTSDEFSASTSSGNSFYVFRSDQTVIVTESLAPAPHTKKRGISIRCVQD